MTNTSYLPIQAFAKTNSSYLGGLQKIWFVPREYLNGFPELNPLTQELASEPALLAGKSWFGPLEITPDFVGYEEVSAVAAAGHCYKRKVTFLEAGLAAVNFINISNLIDYEFCIVGLVRSGAFYIVVGNDHAGLKLDLNASTGEGPLGKATSKLVLADENKDRAIVLPSFSY